MTVNHCNQSAAAILIAAGYWCVLEGMAKAQRIASSRSGLLSHIFTNQLINNVEPRRIDGSRICLIHNVHPPQVPRITHSAHRLTQSLHNPYTILICLFICLIPPELRDLPGICLFWEQGSSGKLCVPALYTMRVTWPTTCQSHLTSLTQSGCNLPGGHLTGLSQLGVTCPEFTRWYKRSIYSYNKYIKNLDWVDFSFVTTI